MIRQHDLVQRRDTARGAGELVELMQVQIECAARGHVFIPRIPVQRVERCVICNVRRRPS